RHAPGPEAGLQESRSTTHAALSKRERGPMCVTSSSPATPMRLSPRFVRSLLHTPTVGSTSGRYRRNLSSGRTSRPSSQVSAATRYLFASARRAARSGPVRASGRFGLARVRVRAFGSQRRRHDLDRHGSVVALGPHDLAETRELELALAW